MTEEIIKECKNCGALGIDSEIGVYYCCLSHRQDYLPKEFTCNDFTPNKQLKRLEQENKELKNKIQILNKDSHARLREMSVLDVELDKIGVITNKYRSALEEIKEDIQNFYGCEDSSNDYKLVNMIDKINEVLNDNRE